jgi:hypothetical protein
VLGHLSNVGPPKQINNWLAQGNPRTKKLVDSGGLSKFMTEGGECISNSKTFKIIIVFSCVT